VLLFNTHFLDECTRQNNFAYAYTRNETFAQLHKTSNYFIPAKADI
jgi:hypothetical protein